MLDNNEIRARAREYLTGKWGVLAWIVFIYSILSGVLGYIPGVGILASLLINGPMTLSLALIFLRVTRGEEIKIEMLFEGFNNFARSFLTALLMIIFVFLWTLLLIVPGIIASLAYSMSFFILAENPEISAIDALKQSKAMMSGHKTELMMLYVSFLGWCLLGVLTFGIAFFWINSYIQTSMAIFYQELKLEAPAVRE